MWKDQETSGNAFASLETTAPERVEENSLAMPPSKLEGDKVRASPSGPKPSHALLGLHHLLKMSLGSSLDINCFSELEMIFILTVNIHCQATEVVRYPGEK